MDTEDDTYNALKKWSYEDVWELWSSGFYYTTVDDFHINCKKLLEKTGWSWSELISHRSTQHG